ncbi:DH domain-containing protein [Entamoeba marina]
MEVHERFKAYLVLSGNLLFEDSARLVNRNLGEEIQQPSILKLFSYLFEHYLPLNDYSTFVKDFDNLRNKLGELYTDDSPLVACVTNLIRIIKLRAKLIGILPSLPESADLFSQPDISQTPAYKGLINKTSLEERRVKEIDDSTNICLVPLKRNILNELHILKGLIQCVDCIKQKKYEELNTIYSECLDTYEQWKTSINNELRGCEELKKTSNKTFTEFPYFEMIQKWIDAIGDIINIFGNGKIDDFQLILAIPTQTAVVFDDYQHIYHEEISLINLNEHVYYYILPIKKEIGVIIIQSNKQMMRREKYFNFIEKLLSNMFSFSSIFH